MPVENVVLVPDFGFPRAWECACRAAQGVFNATGGMPHVLTIGVDGMSAIMQLSWDDEGEKAQTIRDIMAMLGGRCLWYIFSAEAHYLTVSGEEAREHGLPSPSLDPDSIECLIMVGHASDGQHRVIKWDIARDDDSVSLVNRDPGKDTDVLHDLWSNLLLVSKPEEVV